MKIRTDYWAKPIPDRSFDWSAVDDDTYDGAPDSSTRNQIGHGATEAEAIAELIERFDNECICDCADNQDRHVIADCPNRKPLEERR